MIFKVNRLCSAVCRFQLMPSSCRVCSLGRWVSLGSGDISVPHDQEGRESEAMKSKSPRSTKYDQGPPKRAESRTLRTATNRRAER